MEEAVQPQNVHMAAMRLDLDLPSQLVLHAVLDELLLVQHLQSEYKAGAAVPRNVHRAKFASAQALANINVLEGEPRCLGCCCHVLWPASLFAGCAERHCSVC